MKSKLLRLLISLSSVCGIGILYGCGGGTAHAASSAFSDDFRFGQFRGGGADGDVDVVGNECNGMHGVVEPKPGRLVGIGCNVGDTVG